jgi:hypothetical protein
MSMCLWAVGKLGIQSDSKWAHTIAERVHPLLHHASSLQLSLILWGLYTSGYTPSKEWVSDLLQSIYSSGKMSLAEPRHLSRIMYCLAKMKHASSVPAILLGNVTQVMPRDQMLHSKDRHIQRDATAVFDMVIPRPWLSRYFEITYLQLFDFDPFSCTLALWSLATLKVMPDIYIHHHYRLNACIPAVETDIFLSFLPLTHL